MNSAHQTAANTIRQVSVAVAGNIQIGLMTAQKEREWWNGRVSTRHTNVDVPHCVGNRRLLSAPEHMLIQSQASLSDKITH